MELLWLGVVVSLLAVVGVILVNSFGIGLMMHRRERSLLAALVTLAGLSLSQFTMVLIPIDVFNASHSSPEVYDTVNSILQISYYCQ
jgi:hypothetical protein